MNRYPVWKYIVIAITVLLGALYTAPNYFGESPALQVTSGKSTVKVGSDVTAKVEQVLKQENIKTDGIALDGTGSHVSVRARFFDTDTQFKAKLALEHALNADPNDPTYIVTNNLTANTPVWMQKIRALPMYLGLDLRGGVHFLMQVDVKAALEKRVTGIQTSVRTALRDKNIRHAGIERKDNTVEVKFRDDDTRKKARAVLADMQELNIADAADGADLKLVLSLKPAALKEAMDNGVKQNIATLSKRVNELGVAEPIIQQQGADRIVVQLPGVQDVARAKSIIGRTATLEVRMVDETVVPGTELQSAVPFNSELFTVGKNVPVVLYKDIVLSGDYISRATASFDQNHNAAVSIDLNGDGGRKIREATRDRVGKKMAIVLYEQKGKPEVLSVATIQSELGSSFQITGMGNSENAAELALLLRSGALYAPMTVIEERTVGPALGAENIQKGKMSMIYGFSAIAVFMVIYYMLFGFFSVLALGVNLLLLMALLSMMQATLTLPGIAAIALALGMAIDANVLINERIREELRKGNTPQAAIADGFKHAWDTIIDSNVTTLIVGIALYVFGSGPVRGFAVVHCLGILTSMFSAVFVSRGVVNLWYGRKKKLQSVSIGTVWVPGQSK
ncbi:protein translocase subunit SecD [Pseudoduganella ginsengisoli]|uniref:Protein translocase subunit SecD n=1 Tax=Pseudoduganella ginsengisoli TaxID=1462440 RepID=A0A6L6PUY6_9BURK|nr:protein translocase subunit SecD [Pseudoduganella ginsengisoli]MTW01353.1 protein translocase subunit SecD [Pseudoduganella ginsengisoli]